MPVNLQISQAELKTMKTEKGSKLLPFKQEIVYLRKEGIPFSSIQTWLAKKGVDSMILTRGKRCVRYKNEFSDVEFYLKDETISDNEDYTYDNDQEIPDDNDQKIPANIPF